MASKKIFFLIKEKIMRNELELTTKIREGDKDVAKKMWRYKGLVDKDKIRGNEYEGEFFPVDWETSPENFSVGINPKTGLCSLASKGSTGLVNDWMCQTTTKETRRNISDEKVEVTQDVFAEFSRLGRVFEGKKEIRTREIPKPPETCGHYLKKTSCNLNVGCKWYAGSCSGEPGKKKSKSKRRRETEIPFKYGVNINDRPEPGYDKDKARTELRKKLTRIRSNERDAKKQERKMLKNLRDLLSDLIKEEGVPAAESYQEDRLFNKGMFTIVEKTHRSKENAKQVTIRRTNVGVNEGSGYKYKYVIFQKTGDILPKNDEELVPFMLRNNFQVEIGSKTFMIDIDESFYKAWEKREIKKKKIKEKDSEEKRADILSMKEINIFFGIILETEKKNRKFINAFNTFTESNGENIKKKLIKGSLRALWKDFFSLKLKYKEEIKKKLRSNTFSCRHHLYDLFSKGKNTYELNNYSDFLNGNIFSQNKIIFQFADEKNQKKFTEEVISEMYRKKKTMESLGVDRIADKKEMFRSKAFIYLVDNLLTAKFEDIFKGLSVGEFNDKFIKKNYDNFFHKIYSGKLKENEKKTKNIPKKMIVLRNSFCFGKRSERKNFYNDISKKFTNEVEKVIFEYIREMRKIIKEEVPTISTFSFHSESYIFDNLQENKKKV